MVRAGTVPYGTAWDWQRDLVERRATDAIGDALLLLEHPRVFTAGRRADTANLVFDEAERARRGIELFAVDRGGDFTYHGPGQLVGYPILKLAGPRVVDYVRALEEVCIRALASYGVEAGRVDGYTGVWVGDEKVAAIGVRVSAGCVTQHGFALNVTTDLDDFGGIVPCGIVDRGVASLASLGVDTTVDDAADRVEAAFAEVFAATLGRATPRDLGLAPSDAATA
ncbi:MAG: lipoyl(octanoyl) transferase LipB [Actinobacteria bacterium]|nr:lipoyl(octanoyl) transferase LipB [Actinomycetota bacterium]